MTWELLNDAISKFRMGAERAGHDPQSLPVVVRVNGSVTTSPSSQRQPLTGGVGQVLEDLQRLRAVGADHVFWAMDTEPEEQLAVMAELQRSI
jgi:hypothetical protein